MTWLFTKQSPIDPEALRAHDEVRTPARNRDDQRNRQETSRMSSHRRRSNSREACAFQRKDH